ncbi:hypothetical protein ANANG_G00103070 [Anguilla anguilla]|uniref:Uncharacterized protein n=1 Tax=Anguilla anguilla TaxID=7936 RepID=A0A9D3MJ00_ANGAN|nr:hypothetical protein ANANG_G00103070 [Anguilla anguilla]
MLLGGTRSEEAPRESFREDAQVQVFSQNTWRMNDPPLNIDQSLKRGGNTITPQKHHAETGHSWPALEVCSPHHDARCWERNHGALTKTAPVRDRNEALTVLGERCPCGGPGPVRFFTVASGLRAATGLFLSFFHFGTRPKSLESKRTWPFSSSVPASTETTLGVRNRNG